MTKKIKIKNSIACILVLALSNSFGCVCDIKPDYKTQKDLAEYDFIALVRISDVALIDSVHTMQFEIVQHFKGEMVKSLLVSGGHRKFGSWTSCDLGEDVGEEWLVFAYTDPTSRKLMTGQCTRTFRFRDAEGYHYRGDSDGYESINMLSAIFNKPVADTKYNGLRVEYYPNGNKELEEYYENGKRTGPRILWYPNGVVESRQHFELGKRHGVFEWYTRVGQLSNRETFRNDYPIDTTVYWHTADTFKLNVKLHSVMHNISEDSAKRALTKCSISSMHIYNDKGRFLHFIAYRRNGSVDNEAITLKRGNTVRRYYHENGRLSEETFETKNYIPYGWFRRWDENGTLIYSRNCNEEGRSLKKALRKEKRKKRIN